MNNARQFKMLSENTYWTYLQEANQMHVTAQQKYLKLMQHMESHDVAWKDIRKFLLNEAKRAGLYQKNQWSNEKDSMDYPSKRSLKASRPAWFVAYNNFCVWLTSNYRDYKRPITAAEKKKAREGKAEEKKKATIITRNKDGEESRTEITGATAEEMMSSPVTDSLNILQIQQIIMQNLGVLAGHCEEKGAAKEFNSLMVALGVPDECVEIDEPTHVRPEIGEPSGQHLAN